jgi:hypothetical protein
MYEQQALPAPPVAGAPKKRRWTWIVGGAVVSVVAVAGVTGKSTGSTTSTMPVNEPAVTAPSAGIDTDAVVAESEQAQSDLNLGSQASDPDSMAMYAESAAGHLHEVARLTISEPTIAVPMEAGANLLDTAAADLRSGDLDGALVAMKAAKISIDQAAAATDPLVS